MTRHCLKNSIPEAGQAAGEAPMRNLSVGAGGAIAPDSVTGMIFALEGISRVLVILNGPMGCRFYHSTTSQFLSIRPLLYMPSETGQKVPVDYNYLDSWFFRQQRVPCTFLDGHDYVYGTVEKVREGIRYMKEHVSFDLLAVVNAPGASLIGDRLYEIVHEMMPGKPCVLMESPGFSVDFDYGYEQASLQLLAQNRGMTAGGKSGERPRVNVLGLSVWDRYFEGDRAEIRRLLDLCGIDAGCFLMADCTVEEIRHLPDADLNLVINAQRGGAAARYLEKEYGTPFYECEKLPIGFEAVEELCTDLAGLLHADPSAVEKECRKARAYAWYKINGIYESCGLPKGALFAVKGSFAQVYSYSGFFMRYLGMLPDALCTDAEMQPSERRKLTELLREYHCGNALKKPLNRTSAELLLGDANTITAVMTEKTVHREEAEENGKPFGDGAPSICGIEISLPGMGYTDLVKKTHLGINGALFLIEQVLNGLMTRL